MEKPSKEARCRALEEQHVHEVYDKTAHQFADVQYKAWPKVKRFLLDLEPGSLVADIGCGSGKYLHINTGVYKLGCDRSAKLVEIAGQNGHQVIVCDNLYLPYRDNCFDAVVSIGVAHHFTTPARRARAISELARIVRPGGQILIYVWAMEQKHRKFKSQDVLVPWHFKPKHSNKEILVAKIGKDLRSSSCVSDEVDRDIVSSTSHSFCYNQELCNGHQRTPIRNTGFSSTTNHVMDVIQDTPGGAADQDPNNGEIYLVGNIAGPVVQDKCRSFSKTDDLLEKMAQKKGIAKQTNTTSNSHPPTTIQKSDWVELQADSQRSFPERFKNGILNLFGNRNSQKYTAFDKVKIESNKDSDYKVLIKQIVNDSSDFFKVSSEIESGDMKGFAVREFPQSSQPKYKKQCSLDNELLTNGSHKYFCDFCGKLLRERSNMFIDCQTIKEEKFEHEIPKTDFSKNVSSCNGEAVFEENIKNGEFSKKEIHPVLHCEIEDDFSGFFCSCQLKNSISQYRTKSLDENRLSLNTDKIKQLEAQVQQSKQSYKIRESEQIHENFENDVGVNKYKQKTNVVGEFNKHIFKQPSNQFFLSNSNGDASDHNASQYSVPFTFTERKLRQNSIGQTGQQALPNFPDREYAHCDDSLLSLTATSSTSSLRSTKYERPDSPILISEREGDPSRSIAGEVDNGAEPYWSVTPDGSPLTPRDDEVEEWAKVTSHAIRAVQTRVDRLTRASTASDDNASSLSADGDDASLKSDVFYIETNEESESLGGAAGGKRATESSSLSSLSFDTVSDSEEEDLNGICCNGLDSSLADKRDKNGHKEDDTQLVTSKSVGNSESENIHQNGANRIPETDRVDKEKLKTESVENRYKRYYHVFKENELVELIERNVDSLVVLKSYYDHANWAVKAEKVNVWRI